MNELKTFLIRREGKVIMEGCTLPDNQCAVNWVNSELPAHGCYPNFELLTKLQQRMGNRDIIFAPFLKDGAFYESRFNLIRNEDVGGLTGTGIIAVGCEFSDGLIVLQHTTETIEYWSAGCLVGRYPTTHAKFLSILESTGRKTFHTTVLDGEELHEMGVL